MVQRGSGLGFLDESLPAGLIGDAVVRQDLDGHLAVEPRVARAIDLAHPTRADEREDFVRAKPGTWIQRHHLSTLSSIQMLPVVSVIGSRRLVRDTDCSVAPMSVMMCRAGPSKCVT